MDNDLRGDHHTTVKQAPTWCQENAECAGVRTRVAPAGTPGNVYFHSATDINIDQHWTNHGKPADAPGRAAAQPVLCHTHSGSPRRLRRGGEAQGRPAGAGAGPGRVRRRARGALGPTWRAALPAALPRRAVCAAAALHPLPMHRSLGGMTRWSASRSSPRRPRSR